MVASRPTRWVPEFLLDMFDITSWPHLFWMMLENRRGSRIPCRGNNCQLEEDSMTVEEQSASPELEDDVAIKMPKGRRTAYVIAVFSAIASYMFIYYGVSTVATTIVSDIGGSAVFALLFAMGLLTQSVFQPTTPRLSDYFTKGRLVILGSLLLLAQAGICMIAPNMPVFLIGRGIGGLGAAFLFPLGIASFSEILPIGERAKYLGIYGTVIAISGMAGPVVAGFIVDATGGNWRMAMALPLLLAIIATVIAFFTAPRQNVENTTGQGSFDAAGAFFLGVTLICLVGLLSFAGVYFEWFSTISALLIAGFVVFLILFIFAERKKGLTAVVPLSLFKSRVFTVALSFAFLLTCANCYVYYGPAFVQSVMQGNATTAGLMVTIPSLLSIVLSTLLGVWLSRSGRYKGILLAGALALGLVFLLLSLMGPGTSVFLLLANGTVFFGIGNTIANFASIATVQAKMDPKLIGIATSLVMFAQTLGTMILIAIAGAVFNLFSVAADGYAWIFRGSMVLCIIGLALVLLLPRDKKSGA
jgi:MFS family permease